MSINPNTLSPDDKWFCDHSCGFEPPDDGEGPGHCYDCGYCQFENEDAPNYCDHGGHHETCESCESDACELSNALLGEG